MALPCMSGVLLIVVPFVPITDDFGNPIVYSHGVSAGFVFGGVALVILGVWLAVPSLFSREQKSN